MKKPKQSKRRHVGEVRLFTKNELERHLKLCCAKLLKQTTHKGNTDHPNGPTEMRFPKDYGVQNAKPKLLSSEELGKIYGLPNSPKP